MNKRELTQAGISITNFSSCFSQENGKCCKKSFIYIIFVLYIFRNLVFNFLETRHIYVLENEPRNSIQFDSAKFKHTYVFIFLANVMWITWLHQFIEFRTHSLSLIKTLLRSKWRVKNKWYHMTVTSF